jgi:hypothetical protein
MRLQESLKRNPPLFFPLGAFVVDEQTSFENRPSLEFRRTQSKRKFANACTAARRKPSYLHPLQVE